MPYRCPDCGLEHTDLPHIGFREPYHWSKEFEKDPHSMLTEDLCVIQNRDFFVHGVIEIPVHDSLDAFGWGVWVSHKKENFETYRDNFDSPDIGPFFGWLSNEIKFYSPSTLELKTMAHYQGQNLRPKILLEPTDHPLARHQHEGITLAQAWQIVHFCEQNGLLNPS
jgi:hypothetical protein